MPTPCTKLKLEANSVDDHCRLRKAVLLRKHAATAVIQLHRNHAGWFSKTKSRESLVNGIPRSDHRLFSYALAPQTPRQIEGIARLGNVSYCQHISSVRPFNLEVRHTVSISQCLNVSNSTIRERPLDAR